MTPVTLRLTGGCLALAAGLMLSACDGGGLGLGGGGDAAPIDLQVAHASGVVLRTTSARVGREMTLLNVQIMNGRDREIVLNRGNEASYLLTDSGEKLLLVPSASNANLSIPAGQTIDAALVFAGELPRGGDATLILNENGSPDSVNSSSPRFQLVLPMGDASRGGVIPDASALSGMRPNTVSTLRPATSGGSALGAGGLTTSTLQAVEALRTELGAVETDRGTVVSLPGDVTFDFDKATIRADAQGTLDSLAQLIQAGGEGQITIEGHTDSMGDDAYNKRLSEQRAEAVRAYLVTQGVAESRVRTIGLGELRPVAPNATADGADDEAGRQRNRRVEVILPSTASRPQTPAPGGSVSTLTPSS